MTRFPRSPFIDLPWMQRISVSPGTGSTGHRLLLEMICLNPASEQSTLETQLEHVPPGVGLTAGAGRKDRAWHCPDGSRNPPGMCLWKSQGKMWGCRVPSQGSRATGMLGTRKGACLESGCPTTPSRFTPMGRNSWRTLSKCPCGEWAWPVCRQTPHNITNVSSPQHGTRSELGRAQAPGGRTAPGGARELGPAA